MASVKVCSSSSQSTTAAKRMRPIIKSNNPISPGLPTAAYMFAVLNETHELLNRDDELKTAIQTSHDLSCIKPLLMPSLDPSLRPWRIDRVINIVNKSIQAGAASMKRLCYLCGYLDSVDELVDLIFGIADSEEVVRPQPTKAKLVSASGEILFANVAPGVTHGRSVILKAIRENNSTISEETNENHEEQLPSVASELSLLDLGKLPDSSDDLNAKLHERSDGNDADLTVARIEEGTATTGNEIAIGFGGKDQKVVLQNNHFPGIIQKIQMAEEAVSMREGKKKRDKEAKAVLDAVETEVVAISVVEAVLGGMMSAEEAKEAMRRINEFANNF